MAGHKGYYSLVQYCPDLSRAEAVNVGVMLFCPDLGFMKARMSRGNKRVAKFFGRDRFDRQRLDDAKKNVEWMVEAEKPDVKSVGDLKRLIGTMANDMILTEPRPVKVLDANADLDRLFAELVGGSSPATVCRPERDFPRLDTFLHQERFASKVRFNVEVRLPIVNRTLTIPYAYQNGCQKLIQPRTFSGGDKRISNTAMTLAMEGHLLRRRTDLNGERRLTVVTRFESASASCVTGVLKLFDAYEVSHVREEEINTFCGEIERELLGQ